MLTRKFYLTAVLSALLTLPSFALKLANPADTTIRVDNELITIEKKNGKMDVTVHRITEQADTVKTRRVFRGVYDLNRREEQTFGTDFIRIPFVPHDYSKDCKKGRISMGILSFGFSAIQFHGQNGRMEQSGSRRFSLGLLSFHYNKGAMEYILSTSFDFNRLNVMPGYTLKRNAKGETEYFELPKGDEFGKNRMKVTYFNTRAIISVRPFSEIKSLRLYAFAGLKIKTASSMKTWINGKETRYDGNNDLRPFIPEIGASIRYGWFGLEGTYTPVSIFTKDKGPDLRYTTIGIKFGI